MADEAQAIVQPGRLDDAARLAYAKAFDSRRDTTGGLGSMNSCFTDAEMFDVVHDGVTIARYALKTVRRENGVEVFVVAAAGHLAGVDLVAALGPYIEQQCAGADRLTINTRRRGLVKKMMRQGWTLDSFVMRKKIK